MIRPTCSLLMPLMIVITGTMSTPFECRFSIARSFTSNKFPTARCEFAALPIPSNCRYAYRNPASAGFLTELRTLRELDAVRRRLNAVVADLARIPNRIQEIRGKSGLAARELHRHLPPRLDRNRVVEQRLDIFPAQLVHESYLVGIHEAGVAHHVAAIGQIDRQNRSAAMFNRAACRGCAASRRCERGCRGPEKLLPGARKRPCRSP